jgi:hypothetical protein
MFARNVSIRLKSNMLPYFEKTFENEVLPVFRKQKGFKDEITLPNPGSLDVFAEHAEFSKKWSCRFPVHAPTFAWSAQWGERWI